MTKTRPLILAALFCLSPAAPAALADAGAPRIDALLANPRALEHYGLGEGFHLGPGGAASQLQAECAGSWSIAAGMDWTVDLFSLSGGDGVPMSVASSSPFPCTTGSYESIMAPIAPGQCALWIAVPDSEGSAGADINLAVQLSASVRAMDFQGDDWPVVVHCNRGGEAQALSYVGLSFSRAFMLGPDVRAARSVDARLRRVDFEMTEYRRNNLVHMSFDTLKYGDDVTVFRDGPPRIVAYARTDRDMAILQRSEYPVGFIDVGELRGRRILDAGTGDGAFVRQLRDQGVDAVGLDIMLTDAQKAEPFFVESDMAATPFEAGSFDGVYSTWSVPTYESTNEALMGAVLREFARIVRPGGFIRFTPYSAGNMAFLRGLLARIPELELTRVVPISRAADSMQSDRAIEIRRR